MHNKNKDDDATQELGAKLQSLVSSMRSKHGDDFSTEWVWFMHPTTCMNVQYQLTPASETYRINFFRDDYMDRLYNLPVCLDSRLAPGIVELRSKAHDTSATLDISSTTHDKA